MSEATFIHPTAIVETGVTLGAGSKIWYHAHLRRGAQLGEQCQVGGHSYVAYDVRIGHRVKINSFVYLCAGVTIEDGVMLSAGVTFTNDRYPRATTPDLAELRSSEPDEHTLPTRVRAGATLGARSLVGPGLEIGRFAMVGMGALVTKPVGDFHLVRGQPAAAVGFVCRCGSPWCRFPPGRPPAEARHACPACGFCYTALDGIVTEQPA